MEGRKYILDRIGERALQEDCPICHALACFSCAQEHCTALEQAESAGCMFYKDAEGNQREIRRCFYRLIWHERFDLLEKYADTLAALGLMDEEKTEADRQHKILENYRAQRLKRLRETGWKDTLVVIRRVDTEEETGLEAPQDEQETQAEPEDADEFIDNDLDQVEFPAGITNTVMDHETAEEIDANDQSLSREIADKDFRENVSQEIADEEAHDAPEDIPEELEEEEFDENGSLTYEEYLEREEEKAQTREANEEKSAQMDETEQTMAADGETKYVSVPLNFLYKHIGFPVKQRRPMDPVDLAWSVLGANIVYKAAEDYILTLRLLWSGEYTGSALTLLIVRKWRLETWIGSHPYWMYTNISASRILDQCWATAEEQARSGIERKNRRIAAGVESEDRT